MMDSLNIDTKKGFELKYQRLVDCLKSGKFKKISFLTGAGISTSCGIPDFRSENGLFKQMQEKHKLKGPEEFFSLDFFKSNPKPFYEFAKGFDICKYNPSTTHYFMKFLEHKGLLNIIFTQNIDGLELKAGVSKDKMVFCHGNMQEAHCFSCKTDLNITQMLKSIQDQEIRYCNKCGSPCKMKVVFYGESLPMTFFNSQSILETSDLVFIMGTSLKVSPFNMLPFLFDQSCFRAVVNKEKVGEDIGQLYSFDSKFKFDDLNSNDIFVEGFTDECIIKLLKDCGWMNEFEQLKKKLQG